MKKNWRRESQEKFVNPQDLSNWAERIKQEDKILVTLNGSFDLLHVGHLHIIYEAAQQGDVLLVALNSDRSIMKNKGKDRPIVPLFYRLETIAGLKFVDFVTWFDEQDPRAVLNKIKPHVHVNGKEYEEGCIEKDVVLANGGRIHFVERLTTFSTSNIIEKIKQCGK